MPEQIDCHFDAHCHLFDLQFPIRELGRMIHDAFEGDYPHHKPTGDADFPESPHVTLSVILKWIAEIADASHGGEGENLDMVLDAVRMANPDGLPAKLIAHTMDVYFLFSEPVLEGMSAPIQKRRRGRLQQWLSGLDSRTENRIARILKEKNANDSDISRVLRLIKPRLIDHFCNVALGLFQKPAPYFESRGFRYELKQMEALAKKKKGTLYPFLAVDPRRTGFISHILDKGTLVGPGKPYAGIKLNPRLGYHPACKDLLPLYEWCQDKDIPIVTHCDLIGFPPPELEKILRLDLGELGNPANYKGILRDFPKLRIDFAHFGMSAPAWADQIADFIGQYENVYSDLACYTNHDVVTKFKARQWHKSRVPERTLFGTDFDVMYFVTPGITLQKYYENFLGAKAFTDTELDQMNCTNAKRFLGIP